MEGDLLSSFPMDERARYLDMASKLDGAMTLAWSHRDSIGDDDNGMVDVDDALRAGEQLMVEVEVRRKRVQRMGEQFPNIKARSDRRVERVRAFAAAMMEMPLFG